MVSMLMPRVRRVRIRIRASNRDFALGAIRRFGCLPFVKLNPRNFRSHGRATALFSRFTFSLSLPSRSLVSPPISRWESCEPSHQSLARSPTADINVAIIRVTNEAMPSSLQLAVELIKDKIRQQRRKRSTLWRTFLRRPYEPVLHHTRLEPAPNQLQKTLISYPPCNLTHQFVVVYSIEELFQIEIDHPTVPRRNMLLGTRDCLMRRASGTKPVARFRESVVPTTLQDQHHCLLDQSIQHRWDAKLSHPSVRLRDFHPSYRLRLIGPTQQLFPDG